MKKYMSYLGPVIVAGIFCLAVYLLYNKLSQYSIAEIRASIDLIHPFRIFLALVFAALNYCVLIGYDWLALKTIKKKLPLSSVSLVSVIGQAVSFNFGALLGGTSVRFRFYSAWGFNVHEILHLILILAVAFWIGALGLSGVVFIVAPPVLPPELLEAMPLRDIRLLGYILAGLAVVYIILCCTVRRTVVILGKEFIFPTPKIAVAQLMVSWVELVCAAACMWVLLPSAVNVDFIEFLPCFLMAQVAVVLTHVPGGVGVFELVIIHMTNTPLDQMVFAAVLIYRLVYYILPLLVAATLLSGYEVRHGKFHNTGRWLSVVSPDICSYTVFVGGAILLFSSTLPAGPADMAWLSRYLPEVLIPAGHMICAVSGCLLIFVSYGLCQRQKAAFRWSVALLLLGVAGALLKGASWPPALMAAMCLMPLLASKRRFYRKSWHPGEHIPLHWVLTGLAVVAADFALGWVLYRTVWGHTAITSFDGPHNAVRVRLGYIAICILLPIFYAYHRVRVPRSRGNGADGENGG